MIIDLLMKNLILPIEYASYSLLWNYRLPVRLIQLDIYLARRCDHNIWCFVKELCDRKFEDNFYTLKMLQNWLFPIVCPEKIFAGWCSFIRYVYAVSKEECPSLRTKGFRNFFYMWRPLRMWPKTGISPTPKVIYLASKSGSKFNLFLQFLFLRPQGIPHKKFGNFYRKPFACNVLNKYLLNPVCLLT